jgi:hypothetical protein
MLAKPASFCARQAPTMAHSCLKMSLSSLVVLGFGQTLEYIYEVVVAPHTDFNQIACKFWECVHFWLRFGAANLKS